MKRIKNALIDFATIIAIVCFGTWIFTGELYLLFFFVASLAIGKSLYENN